MELVAIRRRVLVALFSDPELQARLVLKGGNAIELVHHLAGRGSVDLDFSIAGDFADTGEVALRIRRALERHFGAAGIRVFDFGFEIVPPPLAQDPTPWWGGYRTTFKLMAAGKAAALDHDLAAMQREAMAIDPRQGRVFRVDISKHEYCDRKAHADIEGVRVYAYTEEMLALEKLRAICQQLPEYRPAPGQQNPARRARDFFDVHAVVTGRGLDLLLPENLTLCRRIFGVKAVDVALLTRIDSSRDFHRLDWDSVVAAVPGNLAGYDFYFDYVTDLAGRISRALDRPSGD